MVLLLAAHFALSRRRQHGGTRGTRAYCAVSLRAQSRAAQRATLRRRSLRGAHSAPERTPRAAAHRRAPSAAAATTRARSIRRYGACHRVRYRRSCARRLTDRAAAGAHETAARRHALQ